MQDTSVIKRVKVSRIITETAESKTFELEPLDGWQPAYQAGQFITLVFKTAHGEKRRSYSLSSAPGLNEVLSITIKWVVNGEFSRFLLDHLKVGEILLTSGISGMFQLPKAIAADMHFCFLAAGSGIVPCYSQIKTLLKKETNKITLIYSNRSQADTIFFSQLEALRQNYAGRFEIHYLFSSSNDIYRRRMSKWLLEQLVQQYLEQTLETTLFYLCGPYEYMQTIEITLRIQVPASSIIKESFDTLPRRVFPEPPDKAAHKVRITIGGKQFDLEVQFPKSILKAAKEQSIELPYSCEAGRCSSCIATCTKGELWMAYNEVLVDKEIKKGRVLVCQAFPIWGDAEILYDDN